jgi:hypothetical protein
MEQGKGLIEYSNGLSGGMPIAVFVFNFGFEIK